MTVDYDAHYAASPRANAAALRIAAILARYDVGRAILEHRGAGDESVGAGARRLGRDLRRDAAVDLDIDRAAARHGAQVAHLVEGVGNEFLAAEAGIDRHDEDEIDDVDHVLDRALVRAGVHGYAGFFAERADCLQRAVNMRAGFHVHGDGVGAGLGESFQIGIAGRDHQMHVEGLFGVRTDGLHHVGADRNVRHEMSVHHVDMDPVGAGGIDGAHLLAELGEVGG